MVVVRGLSGLSLSQEEEEKEETEEEAVTSDSDRKSVDGEDTAAGEWITISTVHSEFNIHMPPHIYLIE